MIQRIQTIYLFLSGIAMSFLFFHPFARIESKIQVTEFWATGMKDVNSGEIILSTLPVIMLIAIIILISIITVFFFKNRMLQMRLSIYNILLMLGLITVAALYGKHGTELVDGKVFLEYFSIMPLVAAVFNFMAWRGIRKDYLMLKAVERIR